MTAGGQYVQLVIFHLRVYRGFAIFLVVLQVVLTLGFVLGFGFIIPDVSDTVALYLTTGAATSNLVTVGLIGLPQAMSQAKAEGQLDYFLTLPISREAYLAAQTTVMFLFALPGLIFAVAVGAWYYDVSITLNPALLLIAPLAVISLGGVGVLMAVYSPHPQVTNMLTNLIIFYVFFFAPVLIPREQLPEFLQLTSVIMPPTYAADAFRATLTDLPGTHLLRSTLVMAGFGAVSLVIASLAIRRRA